MDAATKRQVDEHTQKIHELNKQTLNNIIETGCRLTAVKELLSHGEWLPWLEREFGWSEITAIRLMRIYAAPELKSDKLSDLSLNVSIFYELTKPSKPKEVKDHFIAKLERGEKVTASEVKAAVIPFPKPEPPAGPLYEVRPAAAYL